MRSEARLDGDEYVINGSKRFITNAGVADLYTVFAKTEPGEATRGSRRSSSRRPAPGFEVGRIEPKMGIKGSTTGEIFFNDMRIPADNLLGEEGEGFKIAMRILDRSGRGSARGPCRARPTTRSSTRRTARRWASRSRSTS